MKLSRIVVPAAVVAAGLGILIFMVKTRPQVEKNDRPRQGVLVETAAAVASSEQIAVEAQGTVVAAQEVDLVAEVAGRVIWVSPEAVVGGRFTRGQPILRVDPRDYELGVQQQLAAVQKAQLDLDLEAGRGVIAEREWALLNDGASGSSADNALALRGPQRRTAEVALAAAQSGLQRAQLSLERTVLRAPFNCFVQSESLDIGQQVSPQTRLARLVGTDAFHVQVSVPLDALNWIDLPGFSTAQPALDGSAGVPLTAATVTQEIGGTQIVRQGTVLRLLGDLDPVGRMARLLIELPNPYEALPLSVAAGGSMHVTATAPERADKVTRSYPPLLLGSYVRVAIAGRTLDNVVVVAREALRDGDQLLVYGAGGLLEVRPVQIAWRRRDSVLINGGIAPGERIITSRLATPLAGMQLRLAEPSTVSGDRNGENDAAPTTPKAGPIVAGQEPTADSETSTR